MWARTLEWWQADLAIDYQIDHLNKNEYLEFSEYLGHPRKELKDW